MDKQQVLDYIDGLQEQITDISDRTWEYLKNNPHISGTVVVFGCPGEEGGSGKAFMARADVLYLIRSPKSANAVNLYERVTKIAQGAAPMTGIRVEVDL